jgi:hypothetical protein
MNALPKARLEIEQLFAVKETLTTHEGALKCSNSSSESNPKDIEKISQSYGNKDSSNSRR